MTSSASSGARHGQEARQPAREHRLARARRACQQEVVTPGGRDLERAPPALLATDVLEIGMRRREAAGRSPPRTAAARPRRADTPPLPRDGAAARARCPRARPRPPTWRRRAAARARPSGRLPQPRARRPPAARARRAPARRRRRARAGARAGSGATPRAPRWRSAGRSRSLPCAGPPARGSP